MAVGRYKMELYVPTPSNMLLLSHTPEVGIHDTAPCSHLCGSQNHVNHWFSNMQSLSPWHMHCLSNCWLCMYPELCIPINSQGTDITGKWKSADLILSLVILLEEAWGSKMEVALPLFTAPQLKSACSHVTSDFSCAVPAHPSTGQQPTAANLLVTTTRQDLTLIWEPKHTSRTSLIFTIAKNVTSKHLKIVFSQPSFCLSLDSDINTKVNLLIY